MEKVGTHKECSSCDVMVSEEITREPQNEGDPVLQHVLGYQV